MNKRLTNITKKLQSKKTQAATLPIDGQLEITKIEKPETKGTSTTGVDTYSQSGVSPDDVREAVDDAKKEFITIFGLFAALLIFLSVEVQVFQQIKKFSYVIGVSSFLLAALLTFALSLHSLFNNKNKESRYWPLFIIILVFLAVSATSFLWGIEHTLAFWKLFDKKTG